MKTVLYCGFRLPVGLVPLLDRLALGLGRRSCGSQCSGTTHTARSRQAPAVLDLRGRRRTSAGGAGNPQVDFPRTQEIVEYQDGAPEDSRLRPVADGHDVQ